MHCLTIIALYQIKFSIIYVFSRTQIGRWATWGVNSTNLQNGLTVLDREEVDQEEMFDHNKWS